jgi:hypothetical protein
VSGYPTEVEENPSKQKMAEEEIPANCDVLRIKYHCDTLSVIELWKSVVKTSPSTFIKSFHSSDLKKLKV